MSFVEAVSNVFSFLISKFPPLFFFQQKYAQAEECFVKVLKLDNDCEDAISELHKVKILQIMVNYINYFNAFFIFQ